MQQPLPSLFVAGCLHACMVGGVRSQLGMAQVLSIMGRMQVLLAANEVSLAALAMPPCMACPSGLTLLRSAFSSAFSCFIHRLILETDPSTVATRVTMRQDGDGSPLSVEAAANVRRGSCGLQGRVGRLLGARLQTGRWCTVA